MIPSESRTRDIEVSQGMKVSDVLKLLEISDTHYLSRRIGGRAIGHRASIFGQVEDSAVLFACQQVTTTQMDLPLDRSSISG